jgi:hypothetical protein
MNKHILPNHLAIYSFANLKGVDIKAVEEAAEKAELEICLVGMNQFKMIDMEKYAGFEFSKPGTTWFFNLFKSKQMKRNPKVKPSNGGSFQQVLSDISKELLRINRPVPFSDFNRAIPFNLEIGLYLVYIYANAKADPVFFTTYRGNSAYPLKSLYEDEFIDLNGLTLILESLMDIAGPNPQEKL